jgi:hypothetical protein
MPPAHDSSDYSSKDQKGSPSFVQENGPNFACNDLEDYDFGLSSSVASIQHTMTRSLKSITQSSLNLYQVNPSLRPIPGNLRQALFEKIGENVPVLEARLFRYKQSQGNTGVQKVSFIPRWC